MVSGKYTGFILYLVVLTAVKIHSLPVSDAPESYNDEYNEISYLDSADYTGDYNDDDDISSGSSGTLSGSVSGSPISDYELYGDYGASAVSEPDVVDDGDYDSVDGDDDDEDYDYALTSHGDYFDDAALGAETFDDEMFDDVEYYTDDDETPDDFGTYEEGNDLDLTPIPRPMPFRVPPFINMPIPVGAKPAVAKAPAAPPKPRSSTTRKWTTTTRRTTKAPAKTAVRKG